MLGMGRFHRFTDVCMLVHTIHSHKLLPDFFHRLCYWFPVSIPFQLESGESDDDSIDWGMSSSSSSESDVEVGGTGYYTVEYFLKK